MAHYVDGFVLPVPKKNLAAYRRIARKASRIFRELGALEYRECAGDDLDVKCGLPFPRGINEMDKCGLAPAPSRLVRPPRVAASPCALECKWVQTVSLTDCEGRPTDRHVVFGQVIGVYIDERFIRDGLLDTGAMQPIMRAGYHDYYGATPELRFAMRRPAGGGGQG